MGLGLGMGCQVDRCILELQMEAEDMYSRFRNAIENVWLDYFRRCFRIGSKDAGESWSILIFSLETSIIAGICPIVYIIS